MAATPISEAGLALERAVKPDAPGFANAMIESPSAALMARILPKEVDDARDLARKALELGSVSEIEALLKACRPGGRPRT